jgi:hypothetical protein
MDKIHFKITRFRKAITIGIEINGRDFIDMVREIERPYASKLAGAYQGIFPWSNFDPVRYFLAEQDVFLDSNGKLAVLGCTCGEVECWPMMTKISVNQETVSWTNFEQPHRGPRAPKGHWKYSHLGPFIFDRQEYTIALKNLEVELESTNK